MDDDPMLCYTGSHFSPAEPIQFHGGTGFSFSAEELSSDSSQDNSPRVRKLASASEQFPPEKEDDSHDLMFLFAEDFGNNSSYGGVLPAPVPTLPALMIRENSSVEDKNVGSHSMSPSLAGAVRYRECMKNHAASLGEDVVDGCREFLACGVDGFDALICSACGCHRNFHCKVELLCMCKHYNVATNANVKGVSGAPTPGLFTVSTSRDMNLHPQVNMPASPSGYPDDGDLFSNSSLRKRRHRTKFSAEQKERMFSFAEYLGWRMAKQSDAAVQHFCDEIGVNRSVFKVWMHNNKNNVAKRNNDDPAMASQYDSPFDY